MKFSRFEELVKQKHPNASVFQHGKFAGTKINVSIIFSGDQGKAYQYNGTYCDVLRKLGIKAIYRHDYEAIIAEIERGKSNHGKPDMFTGEPMDCTKQIEKFSKMLDDVNANYVIV